MKNLTKIVKSVLLGVVVSASFMLSAEQASAANGTCWVVLDGPCAKDRHLVKGRRFKDSDPGSHNNAARCLQRAAEYFNYCRTAPNQLLVTTIFSASGRDVLYGFKSSNTSYASGPGASGYFGNVGLGQ